MLINATNKHHLTKNESEYLANLYDVPEESTAAIETPVDEEMKGRMIDENCLRKLNLLTAKKRPFCMNCQALVGFTWRKMNS